jgi:hypothetical protein
MTPDTAAKETEQIKERFAAELMWAGKDRDQSMLLLQEELRRVADAPITLKWDDAPRLVKNDAYERYPRFCGAIANCLPDMTVASAAADAARLKAKYAAEFEWREREAAGTLDRDLRLLRDTVRRELGLKSVWVTWFGAGPAITIAPHHQERLPRLCADLSHTAWSLTLANAAAKLQALATTYALEIAWDTTLHTDEYRPLRERAREEDWERVLRRAYCGIRKAEDVPAALQRLLQFEGDAVEFILRE